MTGIFLRATVCAAVMFLAMRWLCADASMAINCHLHFWQNDRDLLRATVCAAVMFLAVRWLCADASMAAVQK